MKLDGVQWNVSQQALGLTHESLPAGAENVVVRLTVKYVSGGSGNSQAVVNQMRTIGKHRAVYQADEQSVCNGNIQFGDGGVAVYSGQTASGTACFVIAKNDDRSLRLYVYRPGTPVFATSGDATWFGLR